MSTATSPARGVPLDTFTLAAGFQSAATACGLKPSGSLDLGLVFGVDPIRVDNPFDPRGRYTAAGRAIPGNTSRAWLPAITTIAIATVLALGSVPTPGRAAA